MFASLIEAEVDPTPLGELLANARNRKLKNYPRGGLVDSQFGTM